MAERNTEGGVTHPQRHRAASSSELACSLLPCPFCGPVEIVHQWAGNIEIKHNDACFLHAITTLHGAAHIAAWNRRAKSDGNKAQQ